MLVRYAFFRTYLLVFVCLVGVSAIALAQSYYSQLYISERYYDEGNYEKALETNSRLLTMLKRQSLGQAVSEVQMYQARYHEAMGNFLEFEQTLSECLENRKVNGENSRPYGMGLAEAAVLYARYGHANQSDQLVKQSLNTLGASIDMSNGQLSLQPADPYIEAQLLEALIRSAALRGEFDALQKLMPAWLKALEKRISDTEQYYNFEERTYASRNLNSVEKKRRADEYGSALVFQANALRQQGNYTAAKEKLQQAESWIKERTGTKSHAAVYAKYIGILTDADTGSPPEDITRRLDQLIFQAEKSLSTIHKLYLQIHESLIENYIDSRFIRRSKKQRWELRQNTRRYYGSDKLQHAVAQRLDARTDYKFQNYRSAIAVLKSLHTDLIKVPKTSGERLRLLEQLYELALATDNFGEALGYLQEQLSAIELSLGKNTLPYSYAQMALAHHYITYTNRFAEAEEIITTAYHGHIARRLRKEHSDMSGFMNNIAAYHEAMGRYDSAEWYTSKALELSLSQGEQSLAYAIQLEKMLKIQMLQGNYTEADKKIATINDIFRSQYNRTLNASYAQALETSALYYATTGQFNDARLALLRANRLFKRSNNAVANSSATDQLAYLYMIMERYSDAEDLLKRTLEIRSERYGDSSRFMMQPYSQMAKLQLTYGEYVEADRFIGKALAIGSQTYGENSLRNAENLLILAELEAATGDYEKAIANFNRVIDIQKQALGENSLPLANSLTQLALVKFFNKEPLSEVAALFSRAQDIIAKSLGQDNPVYASSLRNIALVNIEAAQYQEAISRLENANQIWFRIFKTSSNGNTADIETLLAGIHTRKGEFAEAEKRYNNSRRTLAKIFNKEHPAYLRNQSQLARMHYTAGNNNKALEVIGSVLENHKKYIEEFFPILSDREKNRYWNLVRADFEFYNNLAVRMLPGNPRLSASIYDNTLFTKSVLVSNIGKIRNRILASTDTLLINNYQNWLDKKQLLTKALSYTNEQLKEAGIDLRRLQKEIDDLDKQLNRQSDLFSRSKATIKRNTWSQIQSTLKPDEVAVEIIRYPYFGKTFTDSTVYAALLVFPDEKNAPRFIAIPDGNNIDDRYLKFYRNNIRFGLTDRLSYKRFWEPVDEALGNARRVFLSVEGAFSQINVEALLKPDNTYIIDQQSIVLLTNTSDLLKETAAPATRAKEFVLIGNPVFYSDLEEADFLRISNRKIPQLPGAYAEVQRLQELLSAKASARKLTTTQATEAAVKQLNSPRVFHIATHGFFAPDATSDLGSEELASQRVINNPLLRSGLLLANGGELLASENVYSYNKEDGVLTAYEALDLNLDNTELVVLSACETGRGDTKIGDGVYGLQRAFIVAGSKALIMSLFKVDDAATQRLMEIFYEKWLRTGNKHSSFVEAKKELRQEYKEPRYWGAFIMIGGD